MRSLGVADGSGSGSSAAKATSAGDRSFGQRRPHDQQSHSPNSPLPPAGALLLRSCSTDSEGPPAIAGTTSADPQRGHSGLVSGGSRWRDVTMPCPELLGARDTVQRPCRKKRVHTLRGTASLASETPAMGTFGSTLGACCARSQRRSCRGVADRPSDR